jgi:hypothetical protein
VAFSPRKIWLGNGSAGGHGSLVVCSKKINKKLKDPDFESQEAYEELIISTVLSYLKYQKIVLTRRRGLVASSLLAELWVVRSNPAR